MPFDVHGNLAISAVASPPSPTTTGTTLTVLGGQGARFPVPPFSATVWASSGFPTPANAEIVRVTAIFGDQLTIVRTAEPPAPARDIKVGDLIAESITAKAFLDIESGTNFPLITTPGDITTAGDVHAEDVLATSVVAGQTASFATGSFTGDVTTGSLLVNFNAEVGGDVVVGGVISAVAVTASAQVESALGIFTTVNADAVQADSVTSPLGSFGSLGATPLNADSLLSGTVPDARLSVNVLRHAGGYPGGSTTFLRADGTFAAPVAPPLVAHHLTHETGGSDAIVALSGGVITTGTVADARLTVNVLKFTGGYPGGATMFLRSDGVFALPPGGGGVAPHAATHYDGGSDPIVGNISPNRVTVGEHIVMTTPGPGLYASNLLFVISGTAVGKIHPAGGFSWGGALADPGTGNLQVGNVVVHGAGVISNSTTTGADNGLIQLHGGGTPTDVARGAAINLRGAQNGGGLDLWAATNGPINFGLGGGFKGQMYPSGGFGWGPVGDPGASNILVAGTVTASGFASNGGYAVININPGATAPAYAIFSNTAGSAHYGVSGAGVFGAAVPDGSTTVYGTTPVIKATSGATSVVTPAGTAVLRAFPSGTVAIAGDMADQGGLGVRIYPSALTVGAVNAYGTITNFSSSLVLSANNSTNVHEYMDIANAGNTIRVGVDQAGGGALAVSTGPYTAVVASMANYALALCAAGVERFKVWPSGGVTVASGSGTDPGAGNLLVGPGGAGAGERFIWAKPGYITYGVPGTGPDSVAAFQNANGVIGSIGVAGVNTTFNTASDARLKTDRGPLDAALLAHLRVRRFDWMADGAPGRGVFAQEAYEVAPFAVTMGTNEVDADGRFAHPWQVDYSKFVPDLIAGWQQHQAELADLRQRLAVLEARP